jgi:hypothetical protein
MIEDEHYTSNSENFSGLFVKSLGSTGRRDILWGQFQPSTTSSTRSALAARNTTSSLFGIDEEAAQLLCRSVMISPNTGV